MPEVLQDLHDFPPTPLYLILGISFVLHILSLKIWFDNSAKNEALLEMVKSLQTDTTFLKEKITTTKKDNVETLSERIHTLECINWTLSKDYD